MKYLSCFVLLTLVACGKEGGSITAPSAVAPHALADTASGDAYIACVEAALPAAQGPYEAAILEPVQQGCKLQTYVPAPTSTTPLPHDPVSCRAADCGPPPQDRKPSPTQPTTVTPGPRDPLGKVPSTSTSIPTESTASNYRQNWSWFYLACWEDNMLRFGTSGPALGIYCKSVADAAFYGPANECARFACRGKNYVPITESDEATTTTGGGGGTGGCQGPVPCTEYPNPTSARATNSQGIPDGGIPYPGPGHSVPVPEGGLPAPACRGADCGPAPQSRR